MATTGCTMTRGASSAGSCQWNCSTRRRTAYSANVWRTDSSHATSSSTRERVVHLVAQLLSESAGRERRRAAAPARGGGERRVPVWIDAVDLDRWGCRARVTAREQPRRRVVSRGPRTPCSWRLPRDAVLCRGTSRMQAHERREARARAEPLVRQRRVVRARRSRPRSELHDQGLHCLAQSTSVSSFASVGAVHACGEREHAKRALHCHAHECLSRAPHRGG